MSWKNESEIANADGRPGLDRRGWPLAWRLTVWYAAFSFCGVLCATVILYFALTRNLTRENDRFLADRVHVLKALLHDRPQDEDEIKFEVDWPARQPVPFYTRILDGEGGTLFESSGMDAELGSSSFSAPISADADSFRGDSIMGASGRRFHAVAVRAVRGIGGEDVTVQVARDLAQEEELLRAYRTNLWLVLGAAFVVCTVGGHTIARRGLRPVAQIRDAMRDVRPTTLNKRVKTNGLPAELHELAEALNTMLATLEESFDRLTRLAADVAHELRTPIGALRVAVEVSLGRDRSAGEYRAALEACLDDSVRLSRTIDSLMFLAKADKRMTPLAREPVDIVHELESIRELYEASALESGVALRTDGMDEVTATLDRTLFHRAVCNLVENALKNTASGGSVKVGVRGQNGLVTVEVTDTGCGISAKDLPHVFEPFYRVDRARSAGSGGAGLGLAIVKSIASLHSGCVELRSTPGRGTTVDISFPTNGLDES
jgi:two-component system heavy metal sensor histidine kinase CusS